MADSIQDAIEEGIGRQHMFAGAAAVWAAGLLVAVMGVWRASAGPVYPPAFASGESPSQSPVAPSLQSPPGCAVDETAGGAVDESSGAMVFPADELVVKPAGIVAQGPERAVGVTEAQKF